MLRRLSAGAAAACLLSACGVKEGPLAPTPDATRPVLALRDGVAPPTLVPYAIDPSGKGLATATWKR